MSGTATDIDVGLDAAVARSSAALLATDLLGGEGDLAAVLGLVGTLALVSEILLNVEVDGVVVGFDCENSVVEFGLLAAQRTVNLVNIRRPYGRPYAFP